ncbi:MAG: YigZ family protein [Clostridia bacterium]|nr:YigZ family protein [Clostridia bacterium]
MTSYKTVKQAAQDEFIVNKSRFIGYACPCESEEEALSFLKRIREKHRDATHNCYAYVIGANAGIMRYSDDGEPGGTAGLPMMEVLKNRGVVNCCVVVTRYFGGVLLGAGGLVRAYTKGCAIALDAAQVSVMEKTARVLFDVPYPLWDKFNYALQSLPVILESADFQASVDATLMIRENDLADVCAKLTALTDGKVDYLQTDALFYPWPEA